MIDGEAGIVAGIGFAKDGAPRRGEAVPGGDALGGVIACAD